MTSTNADHPTRSGSRAVEGTLVVLAALVAAASVVVRLVGLSRQSYWVDELFSVSQASGSPGNLWRMGSTEVHPPVFAVLAWVWEHLGHSLRPGWMRLLPALFGALVPAVTWRALRGLALSRVERAVLVAATSVCGLGLVYAQEMRSYSPLFVTAIGLTGASLRVLARSADATSAAETDAPSASSTSGPSASSVSEPSASSTSAPAARRWSALHSWTTWAFCAAGLHLFGGLLAAATALLLVRRSSGVARRRVWRALVIAELPQVLWIVPGAFRPGFSRGAGWIQAPTPRDAWLLLTSTFGIGRLSLHADGFPLAAPWGVVAVAAVAAAAWSIGRRPVTERAEPAASSEPATDAGPMLSFLTQLVLGFAVVLFVSSQLLHLWTLRNMIVLAPALTWLVVLGILALSRGRRHQPLVAGTLLLCSLAQLMGTTHAMRAPYKSEFGQAMERAAQLRTQYPALQVHSSGPDAQWLYASSLPPTDAEFTRIMGASTELGDPAQVAAAPVGVPTLYIAYTSTHQPSAPVDAALLRRNRAGCHAEPLVSVAFVVCAP